MKIRTGFVSNSSSSSYVILIPKDFDIEDYIEELGDKKMTDMSREFEIGAIEAKRILIEVFNEAMKGRKTIHEADRQWEAYWLMRDLLKEFIVSKIETVSEMGIIKFISEDDIAKIAGKYKFDPDKNEKNYSQMEMMVEKCESSLYSTYISVDGSFYPCSFCENIEGWEKGIDVLNCENFIEDVWYHPKTVEFRKNLLSNNRDCIIYKI